jgi:hypothetical protein
MGADLIAQITFTDIVIPLGRESEITFYEFKKTPNAVSKKLNQNRIAVGRQRRAQIISANGQSGAQTRNVVAEKIDVKMTGIGKFDCTSSRIFSNNLLPGLISQEGAKRLQCPSAQMNPVALQYLP